MPMAAGGTSNLKSNAATRAKSAPARASTAAAQNVRSTLNTVREKTASQFSSPQKSGLHEGSIAEYNKAISMGRSTQGTTADKIDKVYQALGFDKTKRAAMLGRNAVETGNFDPKVFSGKRRGDEGSAYGLGQWRGDRIGGVQNFANRINSDISDPSVQAAALVNELKTRETGAFRSLRESNNLSEAMAAMNQFERPRGFSPGGNPKNVEGYKEAMNYAKKYSPIGGMQIADSGQYNPTQKEINEQLPGISSGDVFHSWNDPKQYTGIEQPPINVAPTSTPITFSEGPRDDRMAPSVTSAPVGGMMADFGDWVKDTYVTPIEKKFTQANQAINSVPGGAATVNWLTKLMSGGATPTLGPDSIRTMNNKPRRDTTQVAEVDTASQVPFWLSQMLGAA